MMTQKSFHWSNIYRSSAITETDRKMIM